MRLTPIDIQQQQFRRAIRGFERREVQSFLDLIAGQMGELSRENNELHDDVRRVRRELEEYREREATLKQAMLTAQRAIDEIREQAQKEAQLIVSEAEMRAEKILHNAHARANRVQDDILELRQQRLRAVEELRHLLDSHQKLLDMQQESDAAGGDGARVTVLERVRAPQPPSAEDLGVVTTGR